MKGDGKGIVMVMKGKKLVFDIVIWTETELVFCLGINRMSNKLLVPPSHAESHGASTIPISG